MPRICGLRIPHMVCGVFRIWMGCVTHKRVGLAHPSVLNKKILVLVPVCVAYISQHVHIILWMTVPSAPMIGQRIRPIKPIQTRKTVQGEDNPLQTIELRIAFHGGAGCRSSQTLPAYHIINLFR